MVACAHLHLQRVTNGMHGKQMILRIRRKGREKRKHLHFIPGSGLLERSESSMIYDDCHVICVYTIE